MDEVVGDAGDDKFTASVATLGALDVVTGGAGTDTLSVADTVAITSLGGATITGIETLAVKSTVAVGAISQVADLTSATQTQTIQVGSASSSWTIPTANDIFVVQVNGNAYSVNIGSTGTAAAAAAAIGDLLKQVIGVSAVSVTTDTITISSPVKGVALPAISVTNITDATSFVTSTAVDANSTLITSAAAKQVITLSVASTVTATDVVDVFVGGARFSTVGGTSPAEAIATVINQAMGATVATVSGTVVTVTAPVAGTPLPVISAYNVTDASTAPVAATLAVVQENQLATSSAAAVGAPTGVTTYTATSSGVANVSGSSTTDITASGTFVQTSGGKDVTVSASDTVYVSGARGAVSVATIAPTTGFFIATSSTTGLKGGWGDANTGGNKAGILALGGTTVSVSDRPLVSSGQVLTSTAVAIQVGSDANVGTTGSAVGKQSISNASLTATGNITTNVSAAYTSTTGLKNVAYGTGKVDIFANGGSTVSVTGAGDVSIKDLAVTPLAPDSATAAVVGTSKVATVNLTGVSGNVGITSDAISTIAVSDARLGTAKTITVTSTAGANTGEINLVLSNVGTSTNRLTLANSAATSVAIKSGAATAYDVIGSTANNVGSGSFISLTTGAATKITMSNSLAVDLGDLSGSGTAKVATVDASAATGAVTAILGNTPEQGMSFTGGSGNDVVILGSGTSQSASATTSATTKVALGAGNDSLLNGDTTVNTIVGATFNGGDGTDTVAASLLNSGNAAQFVSFEQLGLDLIANGASYDTSLLSGATGLVLLANGVTGTGGSQTGNTVTYSSVKAAQSLSIVGSLNEKGVTALSFEAAVAAGAADSYTIGFAAAGSTLSTSRTTIEAGVVSLGGIETVTVNSGAAAGFTSNKINLNNTDATKLVLSGTQDLTVHFGATDNDDTAGTNFFGTTGLSTDTNGVALIDGSGMAGKLVIDTTDVGVAFAGLTVKGGSANDTITLAQAAVVEAGAGDDTIVVSSAGAIVSGGAGKDTFDITAAVYDSTGVVTNVKDLAAGDVIKGLTAGTAASALGAKADVSTATTLAGALELANGTAGTTAGTFWFQYGGNTYILEDALDSSNASGGFGAEDTVVQITGLFDLSNSVWGSSGLLTIA